MNTLLEEIQQLDIAERIQLVEDSRTGSGFANGVSSNIPTFPRERGQF